MIILSNCLSEIVDEGFIKVANSLAWRIKELYPKTTVISYEHKASQSDIYMQLGKFLLTPELISFLRKKNEPVLFIPISSNGTGTILKLWLLSLVNGGKVTALFALKHPMNLIGRIFLKLSRSEIIVLSDESYWFFRNIVGDRVKRLKAGVDINKFTPVDENKANELRVKYGLPKDKQIVLHVGHMRQERNISCMCHLEDSCHGVIVLSSATQEYREEQLQLQLEKRDNITILDGYLPNIQEIYQLADVYLFPVLQEGACIDLPLSVLEAAACGTPIVCTDYGALKEFMGKPGFYFIETMDASVLNRCIQTAATETCNPRSAVLEYDWNLAIDTFMKQ